MFTTTTSPTHAPADLIRDWSGVGARISDAETALLVRAREKLEALETRLATLEQAEQAGSGH